MRTDPGIRFRNGLVAFCVVVVGMLLATCSDDLVGPRGTPDDEVPDDSTEVPVDSTEVPVDSTESLFARYVALGDKNTAGWRGDGINRESQMESYPVLVARAMGVPFNVPLIEVPGCPPPITDAYTQDRLDNDVTCAGTVQPVADTLHHLAIPGTRIDDLLRTPADGPENAMADLMLGGQTILEAVRKARPTFVSIWFGGDGVFDFWDRWDPDRTVGRLPYSSEFMPKLEALVDQLEAMGVKGGILISWPKWPGSYFTFGYVFATAKVNGLLPQSLEVDSLCATRYRYAHVPFSLYRDLLNRALGGESVLLDCSGNTEVISQESWMFTGDQNWWYDEYVSDLAEALGWAFVSGHDLENGCHSCLPAPPGSSDPTFGPNFGTDGKYLSRAGQAAAAAKILEAINEHYGSNFVLPQ